MAAKHKFDTLNTLTDDFADLSIGRPVFRQPLPSTRRTTLPTWGQIKKLTQEGERLVA